MGIEFLSSGGGGLGALIALPRHPHLPVFMIIWSSERHSQLHTDDVSFRVRLEQTIDNG
jgi:hypothetical protein